MGALWLVVPVLELTAEYAATDRLGISVTGGGGKRTLQSMGTDVPGTELEAGGQIRVYVLGNFVKGMEIGGEVLYEYVKFREPLPGGVAGVAAGGLTVGPFVGYKIATHAGFTFEGQLGARYLAMDPPVTGTSAGVAIQDRWLPLLHLNVGWSF